MYGTIFAQENQQIRLMQLTMPPILIQQRKLRKINARKMIPQLQMQLKLHKAMRDQAASRDIVWEAPSSFNLSKVEMFKY